jgi:hypothetical protein
VCSENRGGPLCGSCLSGFRSNGFDDTCTPCPSTGESGLYTTLFLIIVLSMYAFTVSLILVFWLKAHTLFVVVVSLTGVYIFVLRGSTKPAAKKQSPLRELETEELSLHPMLMVPILNTSSRLPQTSTHTLKITVGFFQVFRNDPGSLQILPIFRLPAPWPSLFKSHFRRISRCCMEDSLSNIVSRVPFF